MLKANKAVPGTWNISHCWYILREVAEKGIWWYPWYDTVLVVELGLWLKLSTAAVISNLVETSFSCSNKSGDLWEMSADNSSILQYRKKLKDPMHACFQQCSFLTYIHAWTLDKPICSRPIAKARVWAVKQIFIKILGLYFGLHPPIMSCGIALFKVLKAK